MKIRYSFGRFSKYLTLLTLLVSAAMTASAYESGPLIDLLVKKGIINDQEAEDLRSELADEFADTSAGKIQLGSTVKELAIKTDVRLRYQNEESGKPGADTKSRSRWRYRIKIGADYQFANGWSTGLQLETAEASDSTNTNFGGYFNKNGDGLFLGQIYIDYTNRTNWADLVNFTAGKKKQPFLISSAFWDSDINPDGFTEQVGWELGGENWLTLRAGQYIIDEEREDKSSAAQDDWLFIGQVEYSIHTGIKSDIKIAPMFLVESGGTTSVATAEGGNIPDNENGIAYFEDMFVVALPVEYAFLHNEKSHKIWGMVGWNLKGDDAVNTENSPYRPADAVVGQSFDSNNLFFNVGYTYGKAKYVKEWEVGVEYRYVEAAAITPNLSDSDFGKNSLNQAGFVISGAYMLSDTIKLGATYMNSSAIDENWTSAAANKGDVSLFQLDLSAKF